MQQSENRSVRFERYNAIFAALYLIGGALLQWKFGERIDLEGVFFGVAYSLLSVKLSKLLTLMLVERRVLFASVVIMGKTCGLVLFASIVALGTTPFLLSALVGVTTFLPASLLFVAKEPRSSGDELPEFR